MRLSSFLKLTLALLTLVLVFTVSGSAQGVSLSLASGSGSPGTTVNLDVNLTSNPTLPASLEWIIGYNAADVSSTTVVAGPAATAAGKSVTCNPLGGSIKCILFGLNTTTIANGVVATLQVALSASTPNASTAISLSAGVASDPNGTGITPVTTTGGTITIVQPTRTITVTTNPAGLAVVVDGTTFGASPQNFQWVIGSSHTIAVTSPQGSGGTQNTFTSWSDGGAQSHTVTGPASATTYTATFQTAFQLTTSVSPSGSGSIQASPASGTGFYNSGAVVQLTASANSGFQFSTWSGAITGSTNPSSVTMSAARSVTATFTSAAQNITVTTSPAGLAVVVDGTTFTSSPQTFQWTPGSSHTIGVTSPQGTGGTQNTFTSWSDGGAQSHTVTGPAGATTYTATFQTAFQLTTSVSPSGSGSIQASPASGTGFYNSGAVVQLTASANSGFQFSTWSGDASGSANPVSVTLSAPRNVTANFNTAAQNITVTTNPSGLAVVVDGTTFTSSPQSFQWTPGSSHTIGVTSPQGTGGTQNTFTSWSDGGAQSHTVTGPAGATTYTATFQTAFQLTTAVSPSGSGSIQASPASGTGFYNSGAVVQLTASANSGFQFSSWSGAITGSTNPSSVTMSAARSVTATFTSAAQNITVTTSPAGLAVVVDGTTFTSSPQSFQWNPGSSHTIGVTSPQGTGGTQNTFTSWSDGGSQSHTVTGPASATTYTATFQTAFQLTTAVSPSGSGSIQASPASGTGFYNSGTVVQLTAAPNSGFQFSSWSGAITGSTNPSSVTMSAARSATATFTAAPQTITVNTSPAGLAVVVDGTSFTTTPQTFQWTPGSSHTVGLISPQGPAGTRYTFTSWSDGGAQTHTVTAPASATTYTANFQTAFLLTTAVSPSGSGSIQASPSSPDGYYNSATVVQLTGAPNSGFQFSSWSGAITGSTNPSPVTMSAARSVTATFTAAPQTITVNTSPAGLAVVVDGTSFTTTPQTFQWTPGSSHSVGLISPQGPAGTRYTFTSWSDGGAQTHTVTAPSSATAYTASFQTAYLLTTAASPAGNGSVQASPSSPDGYYNSGTAVQLTAAANSGFQFSAWSGDVTGAVNPASVVMSAPRSATATFITAPQGITVTTSPAGLGLTVDGTSYGSSPQTFQWTPGSSHSVSVAQQQGSGKTKYTFNAWSDGGARSHSITAPGSSTTYTATYGTQHKLTAAAATNGNVQASPSSVDTFYDSGTVVQLTAVANSGYQFSSWSGDVTGTTNPLPVTMNAPIDVTASFSAAPQGITVTTIPAGRGVIVDGTSFTSSPQTFQWTPGSSHTIAVSSPQAAAGARYTFASWSDGGAQSHTVTAPSSAATYTATFQTAYLLTTAAIPFDGGIIQASPSSNDGYYAAGTALQLTAIPGSGLQFTSWSGDVSGSTNPAPLTMSSPRSVTANFGAASQNFTVTTNPPGFGVIVDGTSYSSSPQFFPWTAGSSHTIGIVVPAPSGGTRYSFINWSDGGTQTHSVTASAGGATYTASFQPWYLLTTTPIPATAGAVQTSPVAADGYYLTGSLIQLTAAPGSGYQFGSWAGDMTGSTNPVTFAMNGPKSVTAGFVAFTGCNYTLSRSTFAALSEGDIGRVDLTTNDGCNWTVSSNVSWIIPTSTSSGTGSGAIRFLVAANPSAGMRMGTLSISNLSFTVGQAGAGCIPGISVNGPGPVSPEGGPFNIGISSPAGCEWYSSPAPTWLNLSSGINGTGTGNAQVNATSNAGASPRTGSVSVGGIVSQLVQPASAPAQTFTDVPLSHPYFDYITLLRLYGITSGCSGIEFCPDSPTTRGQMAVFIIRSLMGGDNFPYSQTAFFTDAPTTHPYFKYIQKMRDLGITTGCTSTEYCPDAPVTRGQMAVFLVRARLGITPGESFPAPATGFFQDAPLSHDYFAYIQKLRQLGITSGCSATEYCPNAPTTRGQMAVFLIRAFFTP